ncbi:MAG: ATP-binding cassette domain-containing protein, partial [Chloroflexi bacterium]
MKNEIIIKNARLHNLKNVSLTIPKNQLVVITGVSGSGKSSLAFDTLHKEGQRQYLESMGMITDYLNKPEVDSIQGLSPSISIDQHLTNRSPRSTVGTATEVYTYLRLLFARMGHRPCPHCGKILPPSYNNDTNGAWDDEPDVLQEGLPCLHCKTAVSDLSMSHFSFNKPMGACPSCTGLGVTNEANLNLLLDESLSILDGGVVRWDKHEIARYQKALKIGAKHFGFTFDPAQPIGTLNNVQRDFLIYGVTSPRFCRHFPDISPPETAGNGRFEGVATNLLRRYSENASKATYREKIEKLLITQTCPDCAGTRLRPESRAVTIAGKSIVDIAEMSLSDVATWIEQLPNMVGSEGMAIIDPILIDLRERLRRLIDVGVGYLTLARSSPSLSAGEAQRLRLAALLGSGLTGILYVLDEPTTGLHPRDTAKLQ